MAALAGRRLAAVATNGLPERRDYVYRGTKPMTDRERAAAAAVRAGEPSPQKPGPPRPPMLGSR